MRERKSELLKEEAVYGQIYDVVAENYRNAGKEMEYKKSTFLLTVKSHPQEVRVADFLELNNPEFFQAIYVAVMKRLPEQKVIREWEDKLELPKEQFQREVLLSLSKSSVVAINHIHFVENPYFIQNRGLKYKSLGVLYGLTDKSSLREFGKKLPDPIQQIIRKIFL